MPMKKEHLGGGIADRRFPLIGRFLEWVCEIRLGHTSPPSEEAPRPDPGGMGVYIMHETTPRKNPLYCMIRDLAHLTVLEETLHPDTTPTCHQRKPSLLVVLTRWVPRSQSTYVVDFQHLLCAG